jgi:hypothetical protein
VYERVVVMKLEGSNRLQFSFELASPHTQTVQDFKKIFLIHCDTRQYNFFMNYPTRIKEMMTIVLIFDLLVQAFFWFGDSDVCHSSLYLLVLGSYSKNQLASLVYEPIKKMFGFEPFKQFYRHFVSTRFLIVIQISWNHLCTHVSRVPV